MAKLLKNVLLTLIVSITLLIPGVVSADTNSDEYFDDGTKCFKIEDFDNLTLMSSRVISNEHREYKYGKWVRRTDIKVGTSYGETYQANPPDVNGTVTVNASLSANVGNNSFASAAAMAGVEYSKSLTSAYGIGSISKPLQPGEFCAYYTRRHWDVRDLVIEEIYWYKHLGDVKQVKRTVSGVLEEPLDLDWENETWVYSNDCNALKKTLPSNACNGMSECKFDINNAYGY